MLTADPHCADIAATQHDCCAVATGSEGERPAAAAVRVATSGVETREGEQGGAPDARRGPRPRVHGRWHGRGGDEEGGVYGERSGEGEALT